MTTAAAQNVVAITAVDDFLGRRPGNRIGACVSLERHQARGIHGLDEYLIVGVQQDLRAVRGDIEDALISLVWGRVVADAVIEQRRYMRGHIVHGYWMERHAIIGR